MGIEELKPILIRVMARGTGTPGLYVHQALGSDWWTVTHARSHLKLADFPTEQVAIEAAHRLGKIDWDMSEQDLRTKYDMSKLGSAVSKLTKELGGRKR